MPKQIIIDIGDATAIELVEAICGHFAYRPQVRVGDRFVPNTEPKEAFARRMVGEWLKGQIQNHRQRQASGITTEPDIVAR